MPAVRSVLFDMDGVLYAYDFQARLNLLSDALGVPADGIREKIFESGFEDENDLGRMTTDDYIAGIAERLGVDVTHRQWLAARKWAMAPDPAMLDLARSLKDKAEIAMLTNNGPFLADAIAEVAPELPGIFGDRLFVSGVIGMGKEHAETFPKFCAKLGWEPATTLFVDDSARYIAEADKAGLITHHFNGIDGLRETLRGLGLS